MRGADVETNHNLVIGKVKLRLSKHKARNACKITAYNTALLKQKEFTLELNKNVQSTG